MILTAADDPFVPHASFASVPPAIHLHTEPVGGHMGYLEWRRGRLGFWAAGATLDTLERYLGRRRPTA